MHESTYLSAVEKGSTAKASNDSAFLSRMTYSFESSTGSATTTTASTLKQPCASLSQPSCGQASLHGKRGTGPPPHASLSRANTSLLTRTAVQPSSFWRQKPTHPAGASPSNSLPCPPPLSVLSQRSESSSPAVPPSRINPCLQGSLADRSTVNTLSHKSENYYFVRDYRRQASQDIRFEKGLQSRPGTTASRRMKSSSWVGGRAMPCSSTSTKSKNRSTPIACNSSASAFYGLHPQSCHTLLPGLISRPCQHTLYPGWHRHHRRLAAAVVSSLSPGT